MKTTKRNPWAWIPTLYFAQGLPYVAVMTISVIMYKRLGISNTDIALYTGWLYLPWVIKPFWSPFVDIIKTKRWWTLTMQWILAVALAGIAFTIPTSLFFQLTLAIFWLVGFTSATHDIAADGFYMLALTEHEQSLYVGIRSTFYRVATVAGQGLLVIVAGLIETNSGLTPLSVEVNADPQVEWSAADMTAIASTEADMQGEMQFITPVQSLNVSTKAPEEVTVDVNGEAVSMPFKAYAAMMRDSVKHSNERNGFTAAEAKTVAKAETASAKVEGPGAFTTWVRDMFGEEREPYTERNNNIAIVGLRLNKKPAPGEEIVLNVTHKSGDQSIKLEQAALSTRFVFNENNWDRTAWLYYEVDHKLQNKVSASFEGASGNIPMAWLTVFAVLSAFFFIVAAYHSWALPRPASDGLNEAGTSASSIFKEFFETFRTFFQKPQVWVAVAFMLLYRLPEAQLVKLINPFLLDPIDKGGLGLTTGQVGLVYGTVGIIGLTIGGIIGGIVAAKGGLKKWLWPMAWSMSLTCLTFVYLSYASAPSLLTVNICVFIEQFGYGFGFTAYMLYLIYFSEGRHKTAHYAICTGFMALGMMLPGMAAGWLQETIGYRHFFIWTMICCAATIGVCAFLKIDPNFGRKK
ncbi:MAG: AmpG family muropeptide MFS transporter [Bacteroidales bacterium]|nr:AmpG family muropeptide MFS transporter [Bacteroidales bacterium]